MNDISKPTSEPENGSLQKPILQPWELATLPISPRPNGAVADLEHASKSEFGAWVAWNGIPLEGEVIWNFENRCAVVNHCIQEGLKLKIITALPNDLAIYWQLFEVVKPTSQAEGGHIA